MTRRATKAAELWSAYHKRRTVERRNALAEEYLPLVRLIADRLAWSLPTGTIEADALAGMGAPGLLQAIEGFDPDKGVRFGTYASWRIRGAMVDGLRALDWVPRYERARLKAAGAEPVWMGDLEIVLGETDSHRKRTIGDVVPSSGEAPPDRRLEQRDEIRKHLVGLAAETRLTLLLYFEQELTMKEIGRAIGVSESRVSQIMSRALVHIRQRIESRTRFGTAERNAVTEKANETTDAAKAVKAAAAGTCAVPACDKPARTRGLCCGHYWKARHGGAGKPGTEEARRYMLPSRRPEKGPPAGDDAPGATNAPQGGDEGDQGAEAPQNAVIAAVTELASALGIERMEHEGGFIFRHPVTGRFVYLGPDARLRPVQFKIADPTEGE